MDYRRCYATFKGHTLVYCLRWLEENYQAKLSTDFLSQLEVRTQEAFAKQLQPVAGVELLIQFLKKQGVSFCVASNGGHKKIRNSLDKTGMLAEFRDAIFSAEDVKQGKPAPDLFLRAAKQMGVSPAACIVIEDSQTGVQAARAAGMSVFFYAPSTMPGLPARGPIINLPEVEHFTSMQAVMEKFKEILVKQKN